jgi:hypothetical protein
MSMLEPFEIDLSTLQGSSGHATKLFFERR